MREINGFQIISWTALENGEIVILAAKENLMFEYVTALMSGLDAKEWYFGHYFNAFDFNGNVDVLTKAYENYVRRSKNF